MSPTDLRQQYERDGYVVIPQVLDPDLVRLAGEHVEWLREYLRGGAAPEDEQREMGELLKLADALPPRQAGARDPSP